MFGFLKEKLSGFTDKLKGKVLGQKEEKIEEPIEEKPVEEEKQNEPNKKVSEEPTEVSKEEKIKETPKEEKIEEAPKEEPKEKETPIVGQIEVNDEGKKLEQELFSEIEEEIKREDEEKLKQTKSKETIPITKETQPKKMVEEEPSAEEYSAVEKEEVRKTIEEEPEKNEATIEENKEPLLEEKKPISAPTEKVELKHVYDDKRELKAKVGMGSKIGGFLFGGVEIKEKEIEALLFELELSLIESDVEQDAAKELVQKIKQKIIGQKVSSKNLDEFLKEKIKEILEEMMSVEKIDLLERIKNSNRPFKILILGPNGAGKTTSIAKLTRFFQKNNLSVIVAAGDTFRAAAIDQLEIHTKALGVRLVKHQYGADPAAVAFDAIKAAEANKIDVIIIDTAGRQETNKNLMEELRKIMRVCGECFKIYVGEAYAGQGLLEQARDFDEAAQGIDGFILTKIDADAKGGTTISLLYKMKKPVLFVGTGQGYDDFQVFESRFILDRII